MKRILRRSSTVFGLAAVLLFVPHSSRAATVTCSDDGNNYETSCNGQPAGTKCINVAAPLSPIGCCDKGTCTSGGVCNLTNPGGSGNDATCLNDSNDCTTDSCLADVFTYQATCTHTNKSAGATCVADSNDCTTDACNGSGTCVATNKGAGVPCIEDANPCTDDTCDGNGSCTATNSAAGTSCGNIDGNVCTRDQCNGSGTCTVAFGGTEDCSGEPPPQNQCRQNVCKPTTGCGTEPKPDGTTCNDGKDCSRGDNCQNGQCGRGAGSNGLSDAGTKCRDDNTNHPENRTWCKVGTCNGMDEGCQGPITTLTSGAACDDNPCTNATCQSTGGQCLVNTCNSPPVTCPNCGGTNCNPNGPTGDANQLITCGCLGHLD